MLIFFQLEIILVFFKNFALGIVVKYIFTDKILMEFV